MMTASQFYVMARRLEDAYAAQMRSLCKETGVAQTAMDILLFLHNNPGYDTARDICTYRQLKPALSPEELAAGQHCLSVITENIRNINEKGSV